MSPVQLSIFASKISSIADEMGVVLRRSAFSPNIRDRLDYSCALFNTNAELCAQAAHIPVHLGSMAYAMGDIVSRFDWRDGDTLVLNDPYLGGTHLPDVTLISPVFLQGHLCGFVANRAHHANIGSESPGSMPVSSCLEDEGLIISPIMLARNDRVDQSVWSEICAAIGESTDASGDFFAQLSANRKGVVRTRALAETMGFSEFQQGLSELNQYGEQLSRSLIGNIVDGKYSATEHMDDDGQGNSHIPLRLSLEVSGDEVSLDFSGSSEQVPGNINCPMSVTAAGAYYVFRCLLPGHAPSCAGIFRPISVAAPEGCILNARRPAAVAAGNVETSSRVVDLVISALSQAVPGQMPAASQGTMNNLAMGYPGDETESRWSYYETLAGGMGASKNNFGLSATHSHMTNTFNTPIEVLETNFPLRISTYEIRRGSGGEGEFKGGEGLIREYEFLHPASVSVLTERRLNAPPGSKGGTPGAVGRNLFNDEIMPPKCELRVSKGDRLRIETPGGGGYGVAQQHKTD